MVSLIVVYDKPTYAHVVKWTISVVDLPTAQRVVGQLVRRHRRDVDHNCTASHYTITDMFGRNHLPRIIDAGPLDQAGNPIIDPTCHG